MIRTSKEIIMKPFRWMAKKLKINDLLFRPIPMDGFPDKCQHIWKSLGDEQIVNFGAPGWQIWESLGGEQIVNFGGPLWQIRNYTCKKCFVIKQIRSRFR